MLLKAKLIILNRFSNLSFLNMPNEKKNGLKRGPKATMLIQNLDLITMNANSRVQMFLI